ncbi:PREDICTED: uncharacterized protein LOC105365409 [Ceratosolen solmsi marchali]|uniref:Uncharacterized protein LOC105365409 n=1 Tax=Ceratosolen solmsi marchali TaxID=326594 RepID=A0AAJ6YPG7_9HYME|nr:PREDICTED: uncharacterized protein LOC105365409 [Ceratosolen solmsi marchali]
MVNHQKRSISYFSSHIHVRVETLLILEELHFLTFFTFLAQIETILNSRPLEPMSDDPEDVSPLTPKHFLIGSSLTTILEPSLKELSISELYRWQFIQQLAKQFWQSISKWHHPQNDIKIGSLVFITVERFPPCKWPLARVINTYPSKDGLIRVITLKTASYTMVRPIHKLAVTPVSNQ